MLALYIACSAPNSDVPGSGMKGLSPEGLADSAASPVQPSSFAVRSLAYGLGWDRTGTEAVGSGWRTTNDLGYRVELQSGQLVSYSLRLHPCELAAPAAPGIGWLGGVAHAGHSDLGDPSNLPASRAEDIAAAEDAVISRISFEETEYCEAAYTIARADGSTLNQPEEPVMEGLSIHMEGTWQKAGAEPVAFLLQSTIPSEEYAGLPEIWSGGDGPDGTLRATRRLGRLFSGMDFEQETDARLAKRALLNLSENAVLEFWLETLD